jgi:sigma-B regulation protein RsbU (phosphoserine phosphatase)
MTATRVLLVADNEDSTPDLDQALLQEGIHVTRATAVQVVGRPALFSGVDVLLVSASLGLHRVALIAQQVVMIEEPPGLVVFPDGDLDALESCVQGGFDYLVPPFLPSLVRSKMTSCRERWRLSTTVEEMAAAASIREYERELSIAREIQSGFLPQELPAWPGWEFAARFRPARLVSGDFYDGFELVDGHRLAFVVADVCDKGVGAALFMALIRTLLRHTAEHTGAWHLMESDPTATTDNPVGGGSASPPLLSVGAGPLIQAVQGTNRYMARNHLRQGYFATLFFGVLDPISGGFLYINGGHNPPVLLRANGEYELLMPTGPAVGIMSNGAFALGHTSIQQGDSLFMYTDGVVEARDPSGALFGMNRTLEVLTQPAGSAERLLRSVDQNLSQFVSTAEQFDDITMLALHRSK